MNGQPRLAFLMFYTPPRVGGSEKQMLLLAASLNRRCDGSVLVMGARIAPYGPGVFQGSTKIQHVYAGPWRRGLRKLVGEPAYTVSLIIALLRTRQFYDMIYVGAFDISLVAGWVVARLLGRPLLIRFAGHHDVDIFKSSPLGWIFQSFLRRGSTYTVNSSEVGEGMRRRLKIPAEMICHLPNGLELSERNGGREELRSQYGIPPHARVAVSVGSFYPVKRQRFLVECWNQDSVPESLLLFFAGDGPLELECRQAVRAARRKAVCFLGRQEDVAAILRMADLFVYASSSEGMPNSLMEAMLSGLPCVVSDIPPHIRLVQNGTTGLLFQEGNQKDFLRQLAHLESLPDKGRAMGAAAAQHMRAEYGIERTESTFREVINSVATKP